jgi:hypothetical protein
MEKYENCVEMAITDVLGLPLPVQERHAVSVSLPKWEHVVGYEEGNKEVVDSMQSGYPRFRFHDAVQGFFTVLKAIYYLEQTVSEHTSVLLRGEPVDSTTTASLASLPMECFAFHGLATAKRFQKFITFDLNDTSMTHLMKIADDGVVIVYFPTALITQVRNSP